MVAPLSATAAGQPYPGGRAFAQDLAPEAELLGWAAARAPRHPSRALHQPLAFDETAEVLLVQADAGDGLHGPLELQERELRRHQLEDDRPVLHLAPQA